MICAGQRGGSLDGGEGDDILYGGAGVDCFVYDGNGDDVIVDYTTKRDRIKLVNATIESYEINGNDVEFFMTDGSMLTVEEAVNQKIKIIGANGRTTNNIYDDPLPEGANYNTSRTIVKFDATFEGEFDATEYSPKIKMLNASKVENEVELIGNDNNNKIKLGRGGGTAEGGEGNDKLYGNAGVDTFVYSFGKDTIYKYTSGQDFIQLDSDEVTGVKVSGKNVILRFEDGTLTINKGKGERLTIFDSDGETHDYIFDSATDDFSSGIVNDVSAQKAAADYWFTADDQTGDPLGEILAVESLGVELPEEDDTRNDLLNSARIVINRHKSTK